MYFEALNYARASQARQSLLSLFKSLVANGRIQSSLQLVAEKAALCVGAQMSAIIASVGQRHEVVAGWRVGFSTLNFEWDDRAAKCSWRDHFVIWDASRHPYLSKHSLFTDAPFVSTLFNIPIPLEDFPLRLSLVVMSSDPLEVREGLAHDAIVSIHRQLVEIASVELAVAHAIIKAAGADWEGPSLIGIASLANKLSLPAALIDVNTTVLVVNERLAAITGLPSSGYVGRSVEEISFPGQKALMMACREAARLVAINDGARPIESFLLSTLPVRPVMRCRNDVTYVTARTWKKAIKEHQISALRALKVEPSDAFAAMIAREHIKVLDRLSGGLPIDAVVPIPSGSSGNPNCLSVRIGRSMAALLGVPLNCALAIDERKGSSHPKRNIRRPPMRLVADVTHKNLLIVDDVATSGRHIEEATLLLRETAKSSLAIAWIGGDSA